MPEDLYRSDTLRVVADPGADRDVWVVTFDNHSSADGLDREGFGARFFRARGISQIAVLAEGSRWYHYPDTADALAAAARRLAGARRIMTYGSSMGGYAAIRFAGALGAHACLALSPQYSIDPRRVPFEWRWLPEAARMVWQPWIEAPIRLGFRPLVIADGRRDDARHVALIAAETPIESIALNYVGHPVATFLASARLLDEAVLGTLDGSLDPADFRRRALALRRDDPTYLGELARMQPAARPRAGLEIARRAAARAEGNALAHHILATRLHAAGLLDEALAQHRVAVARSGGYAAYRLGESETLDALGDIAGAVEIACEIARALPANSGLQAWAAMLCWKAGDQHGAIAFARAAHLAVPDNRGYRRTLDFYRRAAEPRLIDIAAGRIRRLAASLSARRAGRSAT